MKLLKVKSSRFSAVVEAAGPPQVYTLWQAPEKDRHLQSQVRQNRVLSIQRSESGSDFGTVGLAKRKGAIHLVFPKSLKRFADQRIVGIKWELVKK
ncbi:MAG: hypothetical protein ACR2II_01190 [Chthoniobacterales bacterium]